MLNGPSRKSRPSNVRNHILSVPARGPNRRNQLIALAKTGIHSTADAMNREYTNAPLWHHTGWLALGELVFGLLMIGAGVIPGGARGFMTFLGMIALAFGIAVLVAPDSLHRYFGMHDATGWAFIVTGGISLLASAVSPVFFTGERVGYGRRREVVA